MKTLLSVAHRIDHLNERISRLSVWAVLIACVVSALNAIVRYSLNIGSNAWLELQWYLFALTVMFGGAHVLKINEHVRVDILYGGRSGTARAWIDLLGTIFFLMPACLLMVWLAWPWFVQAFASGETSGNAGGLIRWPVKLLIPAGFALLALQGVSEIIKRVAFLRGLYAMDTQYERPLQ